MLNFFEDLLSNQTIRNIMIIVIGILFILILLKLIKNSLSKHIKSYNWYKTKKAINVIGYVLTLLLIAIVYRDSLGGITIVLGVAGAGIAFALQEVIMSIAGWIAIVTGDFYKSGDRVMLGGIKGDVIDLGVLRTTVMELGDWVDGDLYNGRIVRIANSFVFKEPVFNYSSDFPFLWDEIKIPIQYGSDHERAREIIRATGDKIIGEYAERSAIKWEAMVKKFAIENATTGIMVTMALTDNWIEFTLRYVVDYKKRRTVQDELFTDILKRIDETDGAVRFASATYDIVSFPDLNVNLNKEK